MTKVRTNQMGVSFNDFHLNIQRELKLMYEKLGKSSEKKNPYSYNTLNKPKND